MNALIVIAASSLMAFQAENDDALAIEQKVKESRLSIKSGRAHILEVSTSYKHSRTAGANSVESANGASDKSATKQSWNFDLVFSGKQLRSQTDSQVSILNLENFLWHGRDSNGRNLAVRIMPRSEGGKRVFDLRTWGVAISPFNVLDNFALSDLLERPDRESSRVEYGDDGENGAIAMLSIARTNGGLTKYWVAMDKGWNIVRAEVKTKRSGTEKIYVDTINCQLKQFDSIWFPSEVAFSRSVDGVLLFEDISIASSMSFNDVPDELFTLETMNIPIGTYIHELPSKGGPARYWKQESGGSDAISVEGNHQSNVLLYMILGNLVVGAMFASVYFWIRRKSNARNRSSSST